MVPIIVFDDSSKVIWTHPDAEILAEDGNFAFRIWYSFDGRNPAYGGDITIIGLSALATKCYTIDESTDLETFGKLPDDKVRALAYEFITAYRQIRKELKLPVAKNVAWSPDCALRYDDGEWGYDT